jgi:fructose-1,6-bisphosphatase/inositol monophosphatase family enzyme
MNREAPCLQLRCAAAEYLMLAAGRIHYALYRRLLPWDHAAGQLIHAEAGGHSAHFDGATYAPLPASREGLLLAPDRASWAALHATLIAA